MYRSPSGPNAIEPPLWFEAALCSMTMRAAAVDLGVGVPGAPAVNAHDDDVAAVAGVVDEELVVRREVGMEGEPEQPALPAVATLERMSRK